MYYSSYSLSKNLVYDLIFLIQILLVHSVLSLNLTNEYLSHKCFDSQGKYKPGSEYEENLNFLVRGLYSSKLKEGYSIIGSADAPNVTVTLQCRSDSYGSYCKSCFATAFDGLRRSCPNYKGAIIWYDQCFLGISKFGSTPLKVDYKNSFSMQNPNNLKGDTKSFNKRTRDFLNELMLKADTAIEPDGQSLTYYAAGEKMIGTQKLYAMVQCNHNMLSCKECLEWSIKKITKCCSGKQGARFYGTSCFIRYELYPFLRTEKTAS